MTIEIVRELVDGEWVTAVATGGGGGASDLAAVLVAGGDPDGNPITGPVSIEPAEGSGGDGFSVDGEDTRNLLRVGDSTGGTVVGLRVDFGDVFEVDLLDAGGTPTGSPFKIRGDVGEFGAIGFFSAQPVTQQTGVAVTAEAIHAALVNLGLITA